VGSTGLREGREGKRKGMEGTGENTPLEIILVTALQATTVVFVCCM